MKIMFKVILVFLLSFAWAAKGQNNLVAHWDFDSLSGDTVYDVSLNSNHGTNYGASLVAGMKGKAVSFDGVSDYIRIPENGKTPPSVLAGLGEGSISLWFKADDIPTSYGIAPLLYYGAEQKCDFFDAANKGLIIELGHSPIFNGSRELFYTVWKNGCTYPSFCFDSHDFISTDQWYHFVVVVGPDSNTGYLNGVEMTNRDYNFGNASYSQFFEDAIAHEKMWLGKGHWDRTTQFFDGAIDELKIFSKPLSAAEVQNLYQDTSTTASIPAKEKERSVNIHPNPASDNFSYHIAGYDGMINKIRIIDHTGKVVMHINNPSLQGKLDTGNLSPGTYYAGFYGDEFRRVKKIVVLNNK